MHLNHAYLKWIVTKRIKFSSNSEYISLYPSSYFIPIYQNTIARGYMSLAAALTQTKLMYNILLLCLRALKSGLVNLMGDRFIMYYIFWPWGLKLKRFVFKCDLLNPNLFTSFIHSFRYFFFTGLDYQNDYQYNYDNRDYDEEPQPSLIPQFTIEAQHIKVAKDRVIRLPCRVDNLGKHLSIFKTLKAFCVLWMK